MSDPFAIAAVTDTLRELLTANLTDARSVGIVDANFAVTAQAPDRIATANGSPSRLNLFLYDVASSAALSNARLPERGVDGRLGSVPMLAIDLSYLMTAYASADLEAEIIMGHAMMAMHENPGLSRQQIRELLDPANQDVTGNLQPAFRTRARTLADQIEGIRITLRSVKSEEMSRIWTSLQSHYRPSVVYGVSVLLIERPRRARSAPPVLARNALDRGPEVRPGLLPVLPTLLASSAPDGNPAVRVTEKLKLFGVALDGANVRVTFRHTHLTSLVLTVSGTAGPNPPLVVRPADATGADRREHRAVPTQPATCIEADLSQATPGGQWAAGIYQVEVAVVRPGETVVRTSNAVALGIAPTPDVANAVVTTLANSRLRVRMPCNPPLRDRQEALLFVDAEQYPPVVATATDGSPTFESTVPAGLLVQGSTHLARLRVDGVDSVYIVRDPLNDRTPPVFDATQYLTIP